MKRERKPRRRLRKLAIMAATVASIIGLGIGGVELQVVQELHNLWEVVFK